MPKLFGHMPSPREKICLGALSGLQMAEGTPLPSEAEEPFPYVLDQLFQDCVANSSAMAILHAMWVALGRPEAWPELPSRAWLYALARLNSGQMLADDDGTYIHSLFSGIESLGFPKESEWGYGPEHLHVAPDWESVREASDQRMIAGAKRIVSTGPRRSLDVATAIASGSVVVWGTSLDTRFMDLGANDVWPGLIGPSVGGHAMILHQFRTLMSGGREFASRSSWGSGFADSGSAWVSEWAVSSSSASDFWIVEREPNYSVA